MRRLVILAVVLSTGAAWPQHLTVATKTVTPMVIKENENFTGFSVELWNTIAERLGIQFSWREMDLDAFFDALETGEADVAIAAISVTADREGRVDFSHPILDSGLRIAVLKEHDSALAATWYALRQGRIIRTVIYFLGFIVLCGHILWYAERGRKAIDDRYYPGILEAFWCVLTTMTTVGYGDIAPQRWLGRVAAMMVMVTGISFFGFVITQLTAGLVDQDRLAIRGFNDLQGRDVATVGGTTAETELLRLGAHVVTTESIGAMEDKLLAAGVEAIVYDSPTILHFAKQNYDKAVVVGDLFAAQHYAIAFPEKSPWIEPVNRALLGLRADGTYDALRSKWFGTP